MSYVNLFQIIQLFGIIKETVNSFKNNKTNHSKKQRIYRQRPINHIPPRSQVRRQRGFWI